MHEIDTVRRWDEHFARRECFVPGPRRVQQHEYAHIVTLPEGCDQTARRSFAWLNIICCPIINHSTRINVVTKD